LKRKKSNKKISGLFKTESGDQIYAVIRSFIDTSIKNRQNILAAFKTVAILKLE
jgi:hypothetical protein